MSQSLFSSTLQGPLSNCTIFTRAWPGLSRSGHCARQLFEHLCNLLFVLGLDHCKYRARLENPTLAFGALGHQSPIASRELTAAGQNAPPRHARHQASDQVTDSDRNAI